MKDYEVTITVKGEGENEWYIQNFYVEAENFESIHNHSAYAYTEYTKA